MPKRGFIIFRKHQFSVFLCDFSDFVTQRIGHSSYNASTVSILWQAPQYCLLGTSEVFATIGGLELAHSLAPRALQGLVMGLLSAFEGMASFLGIGLLAVLSPVWIQPDDTHFDGHYDYFFFLLAAVQLFTIVVGLVVLCFTGKPPRARRRSQLA
jgi:solute carrier family 15 (peptide/histidine transporter), member 3/4